MTSRATFSVSKSVAKTPATPRMIPVRVQTHLLSAAPADGIPAASALFTHFNLKTFYQVEKDNITVNLYEIKVSNSFNEGNPEEATLRRESVEVQIVPHGEPRSDPSLQEPAQEDLAPPPPPPQTTNSHRQSKVFGSLSFLSKSPDPPVPAVKETVKEPVKETVSTPASLDSVPAVDDTPFFVEHFEPLAKTPSPVVYPHPSDRTSFFQVPNETDDTVTATWYPTRGMVWTHTPPSRSTPQVGFHTLPSHSLTTSNVRYRKCSFKVTVVQRFEGGVVFSVEATVACPHEESEGVWAFGKVDMKDADGNGLVENTETNGGLVVRWWVGKDGMESKQ
ncbi:hypothetical protein HK104_002853 [Borealophlyctis nickersoniae]|nr:hypothetical protein HK104_002853 [Borealophlyctis nickersoniae]